MSGVQLGSDLAESDDGVDGELVYHGAFNTMCQRTALFCAALLWK